MTTAILPRHFDVVNGDADGLCALHQLRLAEPKAARLVTGVKRDLALLGRVDARPGDSVTVLDLSLDENREALAGLLALGVRVEYFDHHLAAPPAEHPLLQLTLNPSPGVCTSLLVNRHLDGRFAAWAVVGAFGDNLAAPARALAASLGLADSETELLKVLGECLNYNACGDHAAELTIDPAQLYKRMAAYPEPLDFIEQEAICLEIDRRWSEDRARAMAVKPVLDTPALYVVELPDAPWARRILGSHANALANAHPAKVCAAYVPHTRQHITLSLRCPAGHPQTADHLLRPFGGAGRALAAGINDLPPARLPELIRHLGEVAEAAGAPTKNGENSPSTASMPVAPGSGDALLVVDVQNDFLPGGSLAIPDGERVIAPLRQWLGRFAAAGLPVFASRDWHPAEHCSFRAQGGPWPPHCVAGTPGAEFAPALELPATVRVVSKSTRCDSDTYSAFTGTDLDFQLRGLGVRRLFVGGLATDYCVLNTVREALRLGYRVVVLRNAVRAVEAQPGDGARAVAAMLAAGAEEG